MTISRNFLFFASVLNRMPGKRVLLGATAVTFIAVSSHAAVLVSESFNYDAGNLDGKNGGTGWTTAWSAAAVNTGTITVADQDITAPSNYSPAPSGRQAVINTNTDGTQNIERQITAIDTDVAQTVYMSMLVRRDDSANGGTENIAYFRLYKNGSSIGSNLVAQLGHNSNEQLQVIMGSNNVTNAGVTANIGTTYLVVGKLTLNPTGSNDLFEASIFDTTSAAPVTEPIAWDVSSGLGDATGSINLFRTTVPQNAETLNLDEIRIGTTFADVVPVPEPGSIALLGLGSLLMAFRRRNA